jgi:hypothetical protein
VPHLPLHAASDPAFVVSGAACVERIDDDAGVRLRLHRPIDMPGKGYGWDNPGATVRFRSDARHLTARLRFSERHISTSARNGIGLVLVDGNWQADWTFDAGTTTIHRAVTMVEAALPVPAGDEEHEYTLVMPYGDSVEFAGIRIDAQATLRQPAARKRLRWVAYGDSVTQGFDASHIGATYAWQVASSRGWELVNLGVGGRACTASDARAIASCRPDLVTIAIGVNDWQSGVSPIDYATRLSGLLADLTASCPASRIAVITPLWVADGWQTGRMTHPLADYRHAAQQVAADASILVIDGDALIDHDPALFHAVAVHPVDAGCALMAERLASRLPW